LRRSHLEQLNAILEDPESHANILLDESIENKIIPDEIRALSTQNQTGVLSTIGWTSGIVFLIFTLLIEFTWFHRESLNQNIKYHPLVSRFCEITGCSLNPVRAPDLIEMVNRNVYSHPNIKKALMVTITMLNAASYEQAYPDIEIGFSDVRGELVAKRVFSPEEYLKFEQDKLQLLQPKSIVSVGLEIQDPGKQAMTFEFKFL